MEFIKDIKEDSLKTLSVKELVFLLKKDVEKKYKTIKVLGEISSYKLWRSGHAYFDIKDEEALISCVIFAPFLAKNRFELRDGQQAVFHGRMSIYEKQARLTFIVEKVEEKGQGLLALAFLQLKERLEKEGLFSPDIKKSLPFVPKKIGIVTSPQGAALKDMLKIVFTRFPYAQVLLCGVKVQGDGAKEEIASAITRLDEKGLCDVIIVGRGGGSLEDLWAFNEEIVARSIFHAQTPIISAVGHETDFTICDLVADVRAATPSHAASLAVPDLLDLLSNLSKQQMRLNQSLKAMLHKQSLKLMYIKKRFFDPRVSLYKHWQSLDRLGFELNQYIKNILFIKRNSLVKLSSKMEALSPLKVLNRGYSVIEKECQTVKSISNIEINDKLNIFLPDGYLLTQVLQKEEKIYG